MKRRILLLTISEKIKRKQIEQEEESDEEENNQEETRITSADAAIYIIKIKQYFLNLEDITAFESVANLQIFMKTGSKM